MIRIFGLFLFALLAFSVSLHAKDVFIEWKPMNGAEEYELELYKQGKIVEKHHDSDNKWSSDLESGTYSYRLRAIDKFKRPGLWSDPRALVVMPVAPKALSPLAGESLQLYGPQGQVQFKWSPVKGVTKYHFEVKRGNQIVVNRMVAGNSIEINNMSIGNYTWSLSSMVDAGARAPASLAGKVWESEIQEIGEFSVAQKILERPVPISPVGTIVPQSGGKLTLSWKKVEGADSYEVKAYRKGVDSQKSQSHVVKTNSFMIRVPDEGRFVWEVRALAGARAPASVAPASGPKSETDFTIDPNAKFTDPTGYIALSTMLAPYTYRVVSPATKVEGSYGASSLTLRLSGEFFLSPHLGISLGAETSSLSVAGSSASRMGAEAGVKYRISLSDDRFGWVFIPKLGIEMREYPEFRPLSDKDQVFTLYKPQVLGVQVGFDLRKQFSESFSLGAKVAFFKPVSLSGVDGALAGDANMRNLSVGLQGLYWLSSRWGLAAGGNFDMRSISYARGSSSSTPTAQETSSTSSSAQEIYMDGVYFFGSLIFTFGK